MTSKGNKVINIRSENIISYTEVIRNIYRAKTIKTEVYDFLFLWNPNGHAGDEPPTHPNPNGVRILKTIRNIGRSLTYWGSGRTHMKIRTHASWLISYHAAVSDQLLSLCYFTQILAWHRPLWFFTRGQVQKKWGVLSVMLFIMS